MKLLNYSTDLLKMLQGKVPCIRPDLMQGRGVYKQAINNGQKFILPVNGQLFSSKDWEQWKDEAIRLPYPITVLEYKTDSEYSKVKGGTRLKIEGAVVIAIDNQGMESLGGGDKYFKGGVEWSAFEEGVFVSGFLKTPQGWLPPLFGCYVGLNPGRFDVDATGKTIIQTVSSQWVARSTQEYVKTGQVTEEEFRHAGAVWCQEEIRAVRQLTQILECENISSRRVQPTLTRIASQKAKDKPPLFSYHVLNIFESQGISVRRGGTHASPRFHMRRGHMRRLPTGRKIWVRSHTVGTLDKGFVEKAYSLTGAA